MAVLTRAIEVAVRRLRVAFDPEEIVLFGSRAYGQPRMDSDVDLLVVLRPSTEPAEVRERGLARVLDADGGQRVDAHVWAYTPQEMRAQLRCGSTAVRDALTKGERLFPDGGPSRYAVLAGEWSVTGAEETLLQKAHDDLVTAERMLEPPVVPWVVAFHAQQAVEKALKALIYRLGGEPERTHGLSQLALCAAELDPRGRAVLLRYQPRLAQLEGYAIQPRYVDVPPIGEAQARTAVETARQILADVAAGDGV